MSSIRDLCDELGFGPGGQSGVLTQSPSKRSADSVSDYKYDPSDMLSQTRVFIQQHVTSSGLRAVDLSTSRQTSSPELLRISMDLLTTYGLGPRYWPESTASKPVNGYQWPQDKHRISDLLSQILVHQVRNIQRRNNGKADFVDVASNSTGSSLSSLSSTSSLSALDSEPHIKQSNIIDLEDSEIESDEDTVNICSIEREKLPYHKAPEPTQHHPLVFSTDTELIFELQEWRKARDNRAPPGAKRLNSAEPIESKLISQGDNETDHNRFSSSDQYMGYILKRSSNERLLVKICPNDNPHDGVHCQGWLGGDLGFAEDPIATTWASGSLQPFIYPELHPLRTPSQSPANRRLLAEIEDTEGWSTTATRRKRSRCAQVCSPYNLRKENRRKATVHPRKLKSASSSKPTHRTPVSQSKKRGGLNWQGLCTPSSLAPSRSTEPPQAVPTISSDTNLVDNLSSSGAFARQRLRSPTADTITVTTAQPLASSAHITFYFFLSVSDLGAIARRASTCNSADAFFAAALAAYRITASNQGVGPGILGVTVSWDGAKRPIFVLWGDSEAFQTMMNAIPGAKTTGEGGLEVEVRCIVQE